MGVHHPRQHQLTLCLDGTTSLAYEATLNHAGDLPVLDRQVRLLDATSGNYPAALYEDVNHLLPPVHTRLESASLVPPKQ